MLISEYGGDNTIIYLYDAEGGVIGMPYRDSSYATDVWDTYWYEKNIFGDIVAIYSNTGIKLVSYKYDACGNFSTTYHNGGANTAAAKNPFKYRGYYYKMTANYSKRFIIPTLWGITKGFFGGKVANCFFDNVMGGQ